jgi:hypothetical protein
MVITLSKAMHYPFCRKMADSSENYSQLTLFVSLSFVKAREKSFVRQEVLRSLK